MESDQYYGDHSPEECMDRLIKLIMDGQLFAELKEDPAEILACVFTVLAAIANRLSGDPDGPVIGEDSPEFVEGCCELYVALTGEPVPAGNGMGNGLLLRLLMPIIIAKLKEIVEEWLQQ